LEPEQWEKEMSTYYNEFEPYAAEWLRNLIKEGHIPDGEVDTRSIVDVSPDDLRGFTQCHFSAGIGGWAYAARLAGWPDERPIWTGSAPCQPFSSAGQQKGQADERHLWPVFFGLIRACRPPVAMGEQVAAAVGKDWLDGVSTDLEGIGYACGAVVVPACAVDAPHRRDRLWFVADADVAQRGPIDSPRGRVAGQHAILQGQEDPSGPIASGEGDVDNAISAGLERHAGHGDDRSGRACASGSAPAAGGSVWSRHAWAIGADGKARRVGTRICRVADGFPGGLVGMRAGEDAEEKEVIPLLAHGVPARVGKLRAFGNAIVPQVAAEVIAAYMEAYDAD
jgi:DNA (cytosine-5)-methyltransferase 1